MANKIYLSLYAALFPSKVGGILIENRIYIEGKLTFPEPSETGNPDWPVIVKVGFQALFKIQVKVLLETDEHPSR